MKILIPTQGDTELPSIVIIQGSFQDASVYINLRYGLRKEGYPVYQPVLATCSDVDDYDFPRRSLYDDVANIESTLEEIIARAGKTVVMLMHGYGGIAGSEALAERWSYTKRQARGLPGGVAYLLFYSAFLIFEGQSILTRFGQSPTIHVYPDGRCHLQNGIHTLYSDLSEEEAAVWAHQIIPQSYEALRTPAVRAGWKYIPSTYLVAENDLALCADLQMEFAQMAVSRVKRCKWGHSPHLSHPELLITELKEALKWQDDMIRLYKRFS
ncbi:MAG: hypothetical protein Q9210_004318 [Variospora velana]